MPWTSYGPKAFYIPGPDDDGAAGPMPYEGGQAVPYPDVPPAMPYETASGGYAQAGGDTTPGFWPGSTGEMPQADDGTPMAPEPDEPPAPRPAPAYGAGAPVMSPVARGSGVLPPLRLVNGRLTIADNDGNPVISAQGYLDAQRKADVRQAEGPMAGLTDADLALQAQDNPNGYAAKMLNASIDRKVMAGYANNLFPGTGTGPSGAAAWSAPPEGMQALQGQAEYLDGALGDLQQRRQYVVNNPNFSPTQKTQLLRGLDTQIGNLQRQQTGLAQQAARLWKPPAGQKARAAGMHPQYGLPGGPPLDPQSRQQLQQMEMSVRQVQMRPDLGPQQKEYFRATMQERMDAIDPEGRYRNGQQPMSAVEQAVSDLVHVDEEHGVIHTLDPKTGGVKTTLMKPTNSQQYPPGQEPGSYFQVPWHPGAWYTRDHNGVPKLLYDPEKGQGKGTGKDDFGKWLTQTDSFARQYGLNHVQSRQYMDALQQLHDGNPEPYNRLQALRPLRDVAAEQKRNDALQKQQDAAETKRQAHSDAADKADAGLQERASKFAELQAEREAKAKNNGVNSVADPAAVQKYEHDYYQKFGGKGEMGVTLSQVPRWRLLNTHIPAAMRAAAGDPDALRRLSDLKALAEHHGKFSFAGKGLEYSPDQSRWALGLSVLKRYAPQAAGYNTDEIP